MDYYNFLTTPTGRYCELKEILNKDYLVLVKFIESENYKAFFEALDEIILKSIPDFKEFNIIDKCYVYMAACLYYVRSVIEVNNSTIGSHPVSLAMIINNIESDYRDLSFDYELKHGAILQIGLPTIFTMEENMPVIDWLSGIKSFNGIVLKKD